MAETPNNPDRNASFQRHNLFHRENWQWINRLREHNLFASRRTPEETAREQQRIENTGKSGSMILGAGLGLGILAGFSLRKLIHYLFAAGSSFGEWPPKAWDDAALKHVEGVHGQWSGEKKAA